MFIDKESHLPGQSEQSKTVTIKMTRKLLRHSSNSNDCPFFHAMREMGVDVESVGSQFWLEKGGDSDPSCIAHYNTPEMGAAIELIDKTESFGWQYWRRCFWLAGKEFEVKL